MATGTFALSTSTLAAGNSLITLSFTAISDPSGLLSGGNLFTIPAGQGGTYLINQQISNQQNQAGLFSQSRVITSAGTQTIYLGGNCVFCGFSPIFQLAAGNTIQILLSNISTATAQLDTTNSRLQIVQIS